MNNENLKRANELSEAIKKGREEIEKWERADSFDHSNMIAVHKKGYSREYVHPQCIPFDIVKTLTLDRLKKELAEIEKEFELI